MGKCTSRHLFWYGGLAFVVWSYESNKQLRVPSDCTTNQSVRCIVNYLIKHFDPACEKHGGQVIRVLDSISGSGPSLSPGLGHCVLLSRKTIVTSSQPRSNCVPANRQ